MSDFYRAQIYTNLYGTLWAPRGDGHSPSEWVRLEAFDVNGKPLSSSETYSRTKTREPKHLRDPVFLIQIRSDIVFRETEHVTRNEAGPPGFVIGPGLIIRKESKATVPEVVNAIVPSNSGGCLIVITSTVSVLSGSAVCIAMNML